MAVSKRAKTGVEIEKVKGKTTEQQERLKERNRKSWWLRTARSWIWYRA